MSVRMEIDANVATITLDRPDQRNALTPNMLEQMEECVASASARGARAVVIRGEGRVFSAGFDLGVCVDDEPALGRLLEGLQRVIEAMRASEALVVIAAHGAAIAGACAIAAAGDLVVADEGAKLGYPVVLLGISPAVSAPTLGGAVGWGRARELLLDPGLIDARAAHRIGLVHDLVRTREDVGARAQAWAERLAAKPGAGLTATKAWLREIDRRGRTGLSRAALDASLALVGSEEQRRLLAAAWMKRGSSKG